MSSNRKIDIEKTKVARALVAAGWGQFDDAFDENGNSVDFNDPNAKCFCTAGSLWRAGISMHHEYEPTLTAIAQAIDPTSLDHPVETITGWNDEDLRTQSDVLALLDGVIEAAEKAVVE